MSTRIVHAFHIITKNDLGAWVVGVTPVTQEFCNVFDVLMTSAQLVLAAGVIDANE
jgi:hypothetical protein